MTAGVRLLAGILVLLAASRPAGVQAPPTFAARVAQLSEPGGYFDTDDLVSNERSYLRVVPDLRRAGLDGGAYLGVGPDTSFSYIAQTRPSIAFIIDIRRDNLLLHLLFKALFARSTTRVGYATLLFGRSAPTPIDGWADAPIDRIVQYLDRTPPGASHDRAAIERTLKTFGVPLSAADLDTIDRFHTTFIERGLDLKLDILGRGTVASYPTFRDLVLETDRDGHRWSYLASESDFQFVRSLEARDLVIPVVGDLAGPTAVRKIGALMAQQGARLGAYYTSNVEYYLFRDGTFPAFVQNLASLPHDGRSLIVRSAFASGVRGVIPLEPGYGSASFVANVDDLLRGVAGGRIQSYFDLLVPPGRGVRP